MAAGFRVIRSSFICLWDEMLGLIGANLVWFAVSLPLFALFWLVLPRPWAILLAFLSVLVPNPLTGGVHLLASRIVQGEAGNFDLVWEGFRRNLRKVLFVLGIDCGLLALILANAGFYLGSANSLLRFVGLLWLIALAVWLGGQVYLYPFLLRQPDKRSWQLFRDSFLLALANPGFTLTVLACVLVAIALSVLFGLAIPILMVALVALFENQAMATLTEKYAGQKVG